MAENRYSADPSLSIEARVAGEKTRLLYKGIPGATLVGGALAVVLLIALWQVAPRALLLAWAGAYALLLALRILLFLRFRAASPAARRDVVWYWRFLGMNVLAGAAWGTAALLFFPDGNMAGQAMLTIGVLSIAASAVMGFPVTWLAAISFLLPMTLPLALRFLMEGQGPELALGLMVLFFTAIMVISSRRFARALGRSIRSRVKARQREALYASLFDASPLGIFHYEVDGTIREGNPRFAEVIGSSREHLLGLNMFTDLRDEKLKAALRDSLETGEGYYEDVYDAVTADKQTPVRVFFRGIRDENGEISGGVGIIEDFSERWTAERALQEREALLQRTSRAARVGGWELDADSGDLKWTATTRAIHGVSESYQPTVEEALAFYADEEGRELIRQGVEGGLEHGEPFDVETGLLAADGSHRWVRVIGEREVDETGRRRLLGVIQDVTDRKRAEQVSAERQHVLKHVAENVPGMIYRLHMRADGTLSMPYASGKIRDIFGVEPADVREDASSMFDSVHPEDGREVFKAMQESARELTPFHQQFRVLLGDGHGDERLEWIEAISRPEAHPEGGVVWHGFASRITERMKLEEELRRRAYYDELTGLPNRVLVQDRLEHGIRLAHREGEQLSVMYLDLDGFKDINDAWGHGAGDSLLSQVAARFNVVLRESDTLGRIGGDEFLLIAREANDGEDAAGLAERLLDVLETPFEMEGQQVRVTASIGISMFPGDATNATDLLRHADAALYRAKASGPRQWAWYEPQLTEAALARRYLESELRMAVEKEQLSVALQPIVRLSDGAIRGYEALARWSHESEGWISPARFIPVAEARGLITQVAEQIYARAFRALAAMPLTDSGEGPVLSINVAPQQLQSRDFADQLLMRMKAHGIDPVRVELEITEQLFMGDPVEPLRQLKALRTAGVGVSIDDFGTGFSSLSYLRQLPIDRLKVDLIFVRDVHRNPDNAAIVNTVLALAREFGLKVTAEGIETAEEAEHLRAAGCDSGQGYYFGRPELQ